MNVFKKMVEELKNRLRLNVDFKENGLCLNVELKPKSQSVDSTFYISVMGEQNLTGGVLVTVLECDHGNNHLSPKFSNDSDMFVLLNGFLVPDDAKDDVLLKDLIPLTDVEGNLTTTSKIVKLANGYSLGYLFIPTSTEKEFAEDEGNFLWEQFCDYIYTNLLTLLPADHTAKFILNGETEDTCSLYADIVSKINGDYPVEELAKYDKNTYTVLGDCVCRYIYINSLAKYGEFFSKLLGKVVQDIPEDPEGQMAWFKKLKDSTKEEKQGLLLNEMPYWIWKTL